MTRAQRTRHIDSPTGAQATITAWAVVQRGARNTASSTDTAGSRDKLSPSAVVRVVRFVRGTA